MTLKALQSCAPYQRKLLHSAVPLLRKGGTLVYSTYYFSIINYYILLKTIIK